MADNPLRFHEPHVHLETPFGGDAFGKKAEAFARFFGTPKFLIGQTFLVLVWISSACTARTSDTCPSSTGSSATASRG